jgi:hypothetical protein
VQHDPSFDELQARLRSLWPSITLRSIGDVEPTVVVVHSIPAGLPDHLYPVFPAYEERFLCLVLSLLRAPKSRVIYVTSQPVLPRLVDYFFRLVPELDTAEARSRFYAVSLVDGRNRPLSEKLLERPGAIARIRALIADPELAFIVPFSTSPAEVELAVRLGVPLYGADPSLARFGTKRGARRLFEDEDEPHPVGVEVGGSDDLAEAVEEIRARRPSVGEVVVKHNSGVSGLGSALLRVEDSDGRLPLAERMELEDDEIDAESYLDALDRESGVVEERIVGRTSAARASSYGSARPGRSTSSRRTIRCSAGRTVRRTSAATSRPTASTRR